MKVYAKVLCPDVEYKTLSVSKVTTCREMVTMLLNKFRMKHTDPNLFYFTMEITIRRTGNENISNIKRSILVLIIAIKI